MVPLCSMLPKSTHEGGGMGGLRAPPRHPGCAYSKIKRVNNYEFTTHHLASTPICFMLGIQIGQSINHYRSHETTGFTSFARL